MILTAKTKLIVSQQNLDELLATIKTFNEACNFVAGVAWENKEFRQYGIHHLVYFPIREKFHLPAQLAVRCIAKVANAFKVDKSTIPVFKLLGSVPFYPDGLSWKICKNTISIRSLLRRVTIGFVANDKHIGILSGRRGTCYLIYRNGNMYIHATANVDAADEMQCREFMGVDLGISEIASTSDGTKFSGKSVKGVRHRNSRLRSKLQRKQTRAATRRLKKLSGRERRFATHTNHVISKQIVETAKGTGRGIALEDLKGIRDRVTVRKSQRAVLHSWAFAQLRVFITYKAKLAGVPLIAVDPRNTSRECSACGHIDKRNRPNQSTFRCLACGHAEHADINAARVIASRATCKLAEGDTARLSDLCCS